MLQLLVIPAAISFPSPGCNKVTEKRWENSSRKMWIDTVGRLHNHACHENMRQKTEVQPKAFPVWDSSNLIAVNNAVDLMSKTRLASCWMDLMKAKEDRIVFLNVALGEKCPSRMRKDIRWSSASCWATPHNKSRTTNFFSSSPF